MFKVWYHQEVGGRGSTRDSKKPYVQYLQIDDCVIARIETWECPVPQNSLSGPFLQMKTRMVSGKGDFEKERRREGRNLRQKIPFEAVAHDLCRHNMARKGLISWRLSHQKEPDAVYFGIILVQTLVLSTVCADMDRC